MPAKKVAEPTYVRCRTCGTRDDSFKAASRLRLQRVYHAVSGFTNRDHEYPAVCVEVVEIFANSQHAAFARHMPFKRAANARFRQRVFEELQRKSPYLRNEWFCFRRTHGGNYRELSNMLFINHAIGSLKINAKVPR